VEGRTATARRQFGVALAEMRGKPKIEELQLKRFWMYQHVFGFDIAMTHSQRSMDGMQR